MRKMIVSVGIAALLGVIPGALVVKESLAERIYMEAVNEFCPSQPLSCNSCHGDTEAEAAFLAGDYCYFCPDDAPCVSGPTCTDLDQDGYNQEGGDCGPVDCDDTDEWVNPGAVEDCTDGIDNNCNGLVDAADPNAVDCPPLCTDADGDLYSIEGGVCGPVDCDDADASVNPGAAEDCTDGIDNNCNGLVDASDSAAVGCVQDCTDADGDRYSTDGGDCGPVDCDDADASVHPGALEDCTDGIDNDCNGLVDAADPNAVGCPVACTDLDQDGYAQEGGDCGPADCDDADASVHPGAVEDCTDGIDNNCNGLVDTADPNAVGCPVACTNADRDLYSLEGGACGPVDCDDADGSVNPGAREVCNDGIDNDCNGKIDMKDKACKRKGKEEDCDEDDGEDCDDEARDSTEGDDGDEEDGEHHRNDRSDNYSEDLENDNQDQEDLRDPDALLRSPTAGCAMIPKSMGKASPGATFFSYFLVASYIGIVRRIVRRKSGVRKGRIPGMGKQVR